jgi:hypothetical protein
MPADTAVTFTTACARAILAGRKTQARRVLRAAGEACPFGIPGDLLWLREGWRREPDGRLSYEADGGSGPWEPAGSMPMDAARIRLAIEEIRCELLQAISSSDLLAEGEVWRESAAPGEPPSREGFAIWWDSLHQRPGSTWADNPMVWVVRFHRAGE